MIRFIWKQQGTYIAIYLVVLLCVVWMTVLFGINAVAAVGDIWGKLSSVLSLAALGVAALIWYGEMREDWEESLPKSLTAVFLSRSPAGKYEPVMACFDASLTGEADIRAMGQQIGRQLNGKQDLDMTPSIRVLPPVVDSHHHVKRFVAFFYLDKEPERILQLRTQKPQASILRELIANEQWQVREVDDLRHILEKKLGSPLA